MAHRQKRKLVIRKLLLTTYCIFTCVKPSANFLLLPVNDLQIIVSALNRFPGRPGTFKYWNNISWSGLLTSTVHINSAVLEALISSRHLNLVGPAGGGEHLNIV